MNGGLWLLSTSTGILPLGSSRRNQSDFCTLVEMLMTEVVHSVPYASFNSSKKICTACPLGVFCVMRCSPGADLTSSGVEEV